MRLVLDTNVLVSGLLFPGGAPSKLIQAWRAGAFDLVVSDFVTDELVRVWKHLAPRLRATPAELDDFLDTLRLRAEPVRIDADMLRLAEQTELRDPDDLPVLATLVGSAAEFLITGDKDLLELADRFPILTPAAFLSRFMP